MDYVNQKYELDKINSKVKEEISKIYSSFFLRIFIFTIHKNISLSLPTLLISIKNQPKFLTQDELGGHMRLDSIV